GVPELQVDSSRGPLAKHLPESMAAGRFRPTGSEASCCHFPVLEPNRGYLRKSPKSQVKYHKCGLLRGLPLGGRLPWCFGVEGSRIAVSPQRVPHHNNAWMRKLFRIIGSDS